MHLVSTLSALLFEFQPDATRPLNLLQEKSLIPPEGIESVKPNLPSDYKKVNVNTE